jgi:NAD(P)H-hydrate epimerase
MELLPVNDFKQVNSIAVSAATMAAIEEGIFAQGMPVAALMEKAALMMTEQLKQLYPNRDRWGVLVGPGHNGGDALVMARELWLKGHEVMIYAPLLDRAKPLTQSHFQFAIGLGIPVVEDITQLHGCDRLIDGLFGFGLTRAVQGNLATVIKTINSWQKTVISIDLPSGIHTDTGEVLGSAIAATHTFCLGLWKWAFLQDQAVPYLGQPHLLPLGITPHHITQAIAGQPQVQIMDEAQAINYLPLPRLPLTHKYLEGHLLLVGGSRRYMGAIILNGLGAKATGVGMLSIAVPASLQALVIQQLPDALVIPCLETPNGAIAELPNLDLGKYHAIACGSGLTVEPTKVVKNLIQQAPCPLILDADGLNIVAENQWLSLIHGRIKPTILTPHAGEFRRLFGLDRSLDRLTLVTEAAQRIEDIILFKGAKTLVSDGSDHSWGVMASTPALARGGSGDVLLGLIGGLVATQRDHDLAALTALASWWHSQGALAAASTRSALGVDALTLTNYLNLSLFSQLELSHRKFH